MSEQLKNDGDRDEIPATARNNHPDNIAAPLKIAEDSERYRLIVETAQEGIWMLDENNVIVFVNKKMCDILEYSYEELVGKQNYDFKDDEEKQRAKEQIQRRKQGINEHNESTFITKSGKRVWVSVSTNGIFDAAGQYKGSLAMITDITQRKQDEEALKRSEANLSAIIENTTDLVYSLDTDLRYIVFNTPFKNKMRSVYGVDIKQGDKTLAPLETSNAADLKYWEALYAQALTGKVMHFVQEFIENHSTVFVNFSISPIWDNGKVIGLSCFSQDTTQRKLDEEALKRSEANLSGIIENTTDLVYSLDKNLCFITFNKIFKTTIKQIYGFDVEQGRSIGDILETFDAETAQKWRDIYAKALKGETMQFVNEYAFTDDIVWLSYSVNPIVENDTVIGLSCFSRDITRQKIDEIALKKSEASLRTIFDNTDMAYMLLDADRTILSFNTLAQTFSTEQNGIQLVEGQTAFDYFDPARHAYITALLQRVKNGETVNYQISRQQTGTVKWFDITWAGIKNQHGENIGFLLTNRDVTEQKKLEMDREKITADLIQRNKDLEQFTYIISHNLRAPVANILGLTSLLGSIEPADEGYSGLVNGLEVSANNLDAVISDLNQILQVNSRVNEKVEIVALPRLIDDIRLSISHLITEEKVIIVTDFEATPTMRTLKTYLHSVFYNLILNSIKYHRPGVAPQITISSRADNEKITITYQDNGRGIDIKKNASDLFGLYKRFDTSVEGKGMGLFMVKMQVESLGGTISLHSELGKGTRFELEFPVAQVS